MAYSVVRSSDASAVTTVAGNSIGFSRVPLVGRESGAVHLAVGLCSLRAGHIDVHVHSYEESFYVLSGCPVLYLGGDAVVLRSGACGVVPVGTPHAWRADAVGATWMDVLAPPPRGLDEPLDTFFLAPAPDGVGRPLDVRDPRNRHLFLFDDVQMSLDALKGGSAVDGRTVSASMATAALAYSGIVVKMLVDGRLGAQLSQTFMVEYQPGGVAHPHDHPFEEAYYVLEGEVEFVADGERHRVGPGDALWTGVGCIHAFFNESGDRVRWLEASSPQPPGQHSYRFNRDWDYLAALVAGGADSASTQPAIG